MEILTANSTSAWESFVRALLTECETPKMFSLMHILGIVITVALAVGLVFLNKYVLKKTKYGYKITILVMWGIIFVFEIFKQIIAPYHLDSQTGVISQSYRWNWFPFQFCSMPLYVLPIIGFMKPNIVRKRFELMGACFFLLGGIIGIFIPSFYHIVFINWQTLIHHSILILSAIFIAINIKEEYKIVKFFQSMIIFLGFLLIAIILNAVVPALVPESLKTKFNMFFISWHIAPDLPVVKQLWNAVPYPVYLFVTLSLCLILAFGLYCAYSGIMNHKVDFNFKQAMENRKLIYLERNKAKQKKTSKNM